MPLGIEQNNIAPALVASSGQALVQGIRQIGQQISGHLTELQVKRDLGALAQDMQGLNVQSNEFPIQLAQLTGRHPLAAKDDRAKMLLAPLGMAHAAWQAGESEARAFGRQMQMQAARDQSAREMFDYKREKELGDPQNVGGSLVIPRGADGKPEVLFTPPPRVTAASTRPTVLAPGAKAIDATGKVLAENPKPITPSASETRLQKKSKIDLLLKRDTQLQQEIAAAIRRRDALSTERMKITKADDPNAAYLDNTVKAIENEAAELRKRREQLKKDIETIESAPALDAEVEVLPPVPAGAAGEVLPPMGAITTKIKVDPKTKKRYEIDIQTNRTIREVP